MSPLHILVIANLPPWVLGGAENQVARLIEAWVELGHEVEVAGHRIPDGFATLGAATVRTYQLAVVTGGGRPARAASYFLAIARLLLRVSRRFDVIYARGLGDAALSICALKALGLVKLPLVACPINARGAGDASFIRSIPGWRWLVALINRHCEAINLIAPAIEPDLTELGIGAPRLSRIPNGIALAPGVARQVAPGVPRRLIWTGRLSPQKGVDLLLPALARLVASGRDFSLEIVGDGPQKDELESLSRQLGLADRVVFRGPVDTAEVRRLLVAADAFVLPSRYEGMSNSALEALEAGLPVLSSRCGGIDSYLDESMAWLCEPGDEDSLFAALCRLVDAPAAQLVAMGRQARNLVERNFEIGSVGRRNAALLAEVATASKASSGRGR